MSAALAKHYDVVIAGGGLVGISLALALDRSSSGALDILVVESFSGAPAAPGAHTAPTYRARFDARATALSYGSRGILESLGAWQQLAAHAASISDIQVSERGHLGSVALNAAIRGWPALGYVVENAWLGQVLLSVARQRPRITWFNPARVSAINIGPGHAQVVIEAQGQTHNISAGLVAIADGADSSLRAALGIETRQIDYHSTALIATVSAGEAHAGRAFERFTDWGPMALLPLPEQGTGPSRLALVWTMKTAQADTLLKACDAEFLQTLQQRFGHRLGAFRKVGERASFPLRLSIAAEQVRRQIVLVGNAAHSLHPVAGQGFNLALRDVQSLAETLAAARSEGRALGDMAVLESYRTRQAFDQAKTVVFSDRVTALFERPQPVLGHLRRFGLIALDLNPALKNQFIDYSAGFHAGAAIGLPQ